MDTNLGEKIPIENRKRFPLSFSSNSKSNENGKGSDVRRSCWIGSGLIVEVDEDWDSTKGGVKIFKWVARASIELGKCKLGLGPNQLLAQQTFSTSSLGPSTTSPNSFEPEECSKDSIGPCFSAPGVEKVR